MPKVVVHEIASDEEPQAKKPKQDRSPLVVLNGECTTKKRQLTLKDMVSPKTKTSTFKPLPSSSSPSFTNARNSETSPGQCKSGKEAPADVSTVVTTPSRGVKRKSTVSDKDSSPPHQHKMHKDTVEEETAVQNDSTNMSDVQCKDVSEKESGKQDVETPKRAGKRNRETRERESPEATKSDKENNEKNVSAASSRPPEKTPIRKPTLESMLIRKTPKRAQNVKKSDELTKSDTKTETRGEVPKGETTLRNNKKKLTLKKKSQTVESITDESPKEEESGTSAQNEEKIPDNSELLTTDNSFEESGSSSEPGSSPEKVMGDNVTAPVEKVRDVSVTKDDEIVMETSSSETVPEGKGEVPRDQSVAEEKSTPPLSSIQTPASKKVRQLSAKQKKIHEEREKKRREIAEEKERKRLEREKEKEARDEAKKLELAKKEEAKQKREEERKQREEEKKQREEEKKQREEEKRLKDAEKDAEKKRKQMEEEEAKRLREEKKLKEQEKFKSFFVVKKPNVAVSSPKVETIEKKFRDFVLTPNMAVAPIRRTNPVNTDILTTPMLSWSSNITHIKNVIADMNTKQKLASDKLSVDMEIISISDPKQIKVKRKILLFHENYRPAYCGSWRKRSTLIGPRRPFGQDKTLLEYDYDSDDDWEEPEEGEDITSEKEDDMEEEKEEDEDEDDGFFVPHGYLSDDEGDEDCSDMTQEAKKKRLEQRRKQFEDEQKSKERGVPSAKIVGPAWQADSSDTSRYLAEFQAVWSIDITEPLDPFTRTQPVAQMNEPNPKNNIQEKRELPESGYGMLIKFLHGSPIGMSRAVQSFLEMWHSDETREKVSKRQLTYLIQNLMKKVMRPGNGMKLCWYASDEVLEKYDLKDLIGMHCEAAAPEPIPPPLMNVSSLLKFTKTSTAEEDLVKLKQQLEDQQAQHKQQQALQQALIQAVRQQEAQKALLQKSQINTLKTFISSSSTARRVPLIPVNAGSGGTSAVNSATSSSPAVNNKNQPAPPITQASNVVPRRVTLVPISVIPSPVVNVDDNSK